MWRNFFELMVKKDISIGKIIRINGRNGRIKVLKTLIFKCSVKIRPFLFSNSIIPQKILTFAFE